MQALRWDLFCRVIDNFGDIGVCWRLATDLAARGEQVRLWVDDPSALRWMAPAGAAGVELRVWPGHVVDIEPFGVVIEAFGCELPESFVRRMASATEPPLWINLEYLSAEGFVERSHMLVSPQHSGPGAGLRKWFYFPGFTPGTGGLIREPDLRARQQDFDAPAWLEAHSAAAQPGEQVVSLFCYEQAALPALLDQLAQRPTLLLATAGHETRQIDALLGPDLRRGALRAVELPALTQLDYDHLLWAADLNFVRGEDSFVRAQWAGKPFVWQLYPQHASVHLAKLDAFLGCFGAAPELRVFCRAWNAAGASLPSLPDAASWRRQCDIWRASLLAQPELAIRLLGFVSEAR